MFEDRWMGYIERCSAWIVGTAGVSAGYLFLLNLSGWHPESSSLFSVIQISGWLQVSLVSGAVAAFVVCISTMLLAVTLESRRINAVRRELGRKRTVQPRGASRHDQ